MPNSLYYEILFLFLFFAAGSGLAYFWFRRQITLRERRRQQFLSGYLREQERLNKAARELLDLLVDIVNAAAISGDSEYLLAKRLHLILRSKRGEGKSLREVFVRLADFCCSGFITTLVRQYPELTGHERSICAMLVIGMDPGTICKVCGFEHEQTFYNKRKEIRRKLGLEHNTPLEGYLKDWVTRLNRERTFLIGSLKL